MHLIRAQARIELIWEWTASGTGLQNTSGNEYKYQGRYLMSKCSSVYKRGKPYTSETGFKFNPKDDQSIKMDLWKQVLMELD